MFRLSPLLSPHSGQDKVNMSKLDRIGQTGHPGTGQDRTVLDRTGQGCDGTSVWQDRL